MTQIEASEDSGSKFSVLLMSAAQLPGVHINRASYLKRALSRYCSEEDVRRAIAETPAAAGIPLEVLSKAAEDSIRYETTKVAGASALAGMPGLLALPATLPADLAQYFGHMLRIAQKLAYLYSWPDLFSTDGDEPDDATLNVLTLFVGVMFGVQSANVGVAKVSAKVAEQLVAQLPKKALTQGVVYPIVRSVAKRLGVEMTKQVFARGVAKVIPFVGGALSGGLTVATYLPMAKKLKKHLASLELTSPSHDIVYSVSAASVGTPTAVSQPSPRNPRPWRRSLRRPSDAE